MITHPQTTTSTRSTDEILSGSPDIPHSILEEANEFASPRMPEQHPLTASTLAQITNSKLEKDTHQIAKGLETSTKWLKFFSEKAQKEEKIFTLDQQQNLRKKLLENLPEKFAGESSAYFAFRDEVVASLQPTEITEIGEKIKNDIINKAIYFFVLGSLSDFAKRPLPVPSPIWQQVYNKIDIIAKNALQLTMGEPVSEAGSENGREDNINPINEYKQIAEEETRYEEHGSNVFIFQELRRNIKIQLAKEIRSALKVNSASSARIIISIQPPPEPQDNKQNNALFSATSPQATTPPKEPSPVEAHKAQSPSKTDAIGGVTLIAVAIIGAAFCMAFPPAGALFIVLMTLATAIYLGGLWLLKQSSWWNNLKQENPKIAIGLAVIGILLGVALIAACPLVILKLSLFASSAALTQTVTVGFIAGASGLSGLTTLLSAANDIRQVMQFQANKVESISPTTNSTSTTALKLPDPPSLTITIAASSMYRNVDTKPLSPQPSHP